MTAEIEMKVFKKKAIGKDERGKSFNDGQFGYEYAGKWFSFCYDGTGYDDLYEVNHQEDELNCMKLINLRKRLEKYNCEYAEKILNAIDECYHKEKKRVLYIDASRRFNYKYEKVTCEFCGEECLRNNIYKHKKTIKCKKYQSK
jgi:hypothetical protein